MIFRDRDRRPEIPVHPLLPLRDVVVFPGAPMSLIVGRERSVAAVRAAEAAGIELMLVAQRNGASDSPGPDDLHPFGTLAAVVQLLNLPDGNVKVLVEGRHRARVLRFAATEPFFEVEVERHEPSSDQPPEVQSLVRTVKSAFEGYVKLNRALPPEMLLGVNAIEDADRLADTLAAALKLKPHELQELLELTDVGERLERVYRALLNEIEFLQVERKLKSRARRERENTQRDVLLDEQIKALQKDIGDKDGREDVEDIARRLAEKTLPEAVKARADRELRRLAQMNLLSAEANVVRSWLDWVLDLPWSEESELCTDLVAAGKVLDEDHYGLVKVKERILEVLAVGQLVERPQGPILCLVGPPGVGKTSFARSIARATGRPFLRIALGGVRDEAEIRGHRRTYIGALPGRILQAMKRAGALDPVLLLDEIDKMSSDMRGDPASALLEVLDPEQNQAFNDHYLDLDYDLSKVMFVCTANTVAGIPAPMLDRLELIELSGYTETEKLAIAVRHLMPRQRRLAGLTDAQLEVSQPALLEIVRRYTRESGVRSLERQLGSICRKVARRVVHHGPETAVRLVRGNLDKLLGPPRYRFGQKEDEDLVGLVRGLSVSPSGGELLAIEVATVPGKGKLILTGRLGEVLKESATAVFTYVRSRAEALGLDEDFHETHDFHIHYPGLPSGVEGPSAGIAMATALVSALTGIPVRSDTAMTGEITLRGRVLPIGGLKEKVLAAHRGGITRVLIPADNEKDLEDIPPRVLESVEVIAVSHMDRVLAEALTGPRATELFSSVPRDPEIDMASAGIAHVEP